MSDNEIENLSRFPNPNSVDDDIDDDYNNKKRSKYWEKAKLEVIDKQNNEYNENTTNKQTANSKWDTLVHLISATPSNAKSFLGVEKNKSLINWEERTFKVLRSNRLFGGEIKDSAIGEYLNHVKDNNYSDPFSMLVFFCMIFIYLLNLINNLIIIIGIIKLVKQRNQQNRMNLF